MDHDFCRILLVEDNEDDYLFLRGLLGGIATTQFQLQWVNNCQDARNFLAREATDICLLDYRLGEITGVEFLREFEESETPFILLSGVEDYGVDVAATQAGAADYLVKEDINAALLERAIRYAIQRKKTEARLRQSEAELRHSEENLAKAQRMAHLGSWELDLHQTQDLNANALRWSDEVFRIFGYEPGGIEVSNENFFRAVHPDDRELVAATISQAIEKGRSYRLEHRIIWPDGTERIIQEQAELVLDEPTGEPIKMVGTVQDITEQKQAQAGMARLAAIVESSSDAIIGKSLEGIITSWNRSAEALYGYTALEAIGRSISMLLAPERAMEEAQLLDRIARGERVANYETVRLNKDGQRLEVSLTLSPIKNEVDEIIGVSGISRDISDRKQAENALRASEERFQSIVANVPGMVYQFLLHPDGSIEWPFVSEGCREIYEIDPETFKEIPSWAVDRIYDADSPSFRSSVAASAETLLPWRWEGRHRLASGETRWIQCAARPQRTPQGGTLWNGLVMDITARKSAEEERDHFFLMSLDMLGIAGFDGYFKRLNPAFSETLGYSEAELLSLPFLELVHPDDQAATEAAVASLAQGNLMVGFENRYRSRDGSWHWLEWKSVAAVEEGLIYAAARDVTQRKESEAALRKMREELEVRVQERTLQLEQTNAALQVQIAERKEAEAETRSRARQQEAVAELGQRALTDVDLGTLLDGAAALVAATLNVELSTILELLPGGESLRIRAGIGWKRDARGDLVSGHGDSQASYTLLHSAPTIVPDLRMENRFEPSPLLLENGVTSSITIIVGGYKQPFGTLGAHSTRPRKFTQDDVHFLQAMSNVLAAALERRRIEDEIRQLNDELQTTNEQLKIENEERVIALEALQEVTLGLEQAKEEAERARESAEIANRAKSEFLSRMSHELRTPLNAILGFGQILEMRNQNADAKQQESIGYILKAGRHLLDLINEVLDISRVEAGGAELVLSPTSLNEVVPEACALLRPLATPQGINLVCEPGVLENSLVMADRQRLKQVLLNLISNAIKYNRPQGEVVVCCEQVREGRIRIKVRDSGAGIAPDDLPKLFTPFERLSAINSEVEGTGLGLVLSQRLAAAMGGTLGVESIQGQGSTFFIELPQAFTPHEPPLDLPLNNEQRSQEGSATLRYSVLCIEDNPSNLRLMEIILESRPDIKLLTAMQGSMGLDLARQHQPDVILLDLNLPGISGWEVLHQLRQLEQTRSIPVIVISADATPTQIERLLASGARAYLTKPVEVAALLGLLDELLQVPEGSPDYCPNK